MGIRYISDLHFLHKNIIRYDNRPWIDPQEMTEGMVKRWNEVVVPEDMVYILGDVVWSKKYEDWKKIVSRLNGRKFIIKGNHDKTDILNQLVADKIITGWSHQEVIFDNGCYVILNHSPMPFFVNMHHDNTHHLYGHVHISFDYQAIKHLRRQIEDLYLHPVRMYNVGCMIRGIDYVPRTLDEIIQIDAENRKFEEGTYEDYLHKEKIVGNDKIEMAQKGNV